MGAQVTNVKSNKKRNRKKTLMLLSMVAPVSIWLILLRYIPMFGIVLAFKNYKVYTKNPSLFNNIIHSKWVGWDNFKFLFASSDTAKILRNTVCYNVVWIILGLVISVAFAIMLNEITNKFVAKSYQTLMFFPYFLSWVVVSYFVSTLLDPTSGLIVKWQIAKYGEAINWYHEAKYWPFILTICSIWKNTGYQTIMYLAAITGIDQTQYEAASIDGATKWQQVWNVTIPNIRTMITILLIMNVSKIFNSDFGLFWSVPQNIGSTYSTTNVLDTYVYRAMGDVGMSTAAGLFQQVVGFVLVLIANAIAKKIDSDSSLF